ERLLEEFGHRHPRPREIFLERFEEVREFLLTDMPLSEERKLLIGAYFTQEYALEAAALFNPSLVPHPEQEGLAPGELRFVLSLRAAGEGHISCITFRTGRVDACGHITIDKPPADVTCGVIAATSEYAREHFEREL